MSPLIERKLVFGSFLHSQGNVALQDSIFKFLDSAEYMSYEDALAGLEDMQPALDRYAHSKSHNHANNYSLESTITELKYLQDRPVDDPLTLYTRLTSTDEKVITISTRPMRAIYNGRTNPSHFAYFGLMKVTTGMKAFDELYAELKDTHDKSPVGSRHFALEALKLHLTYNPDDVALL